MECSHDLRAKCINARPNLKWISIYEILQVGKSLAVPNLLILFDGVALIEDIIVRIRNGNRNTFCTVCICWWDCHLYMHCSQCLLLLNYLNLWDVEWIFPFISRKKWLVKNVIKLYTKMYEMLPYADERWLKVLNIIIIFIVGSPSMKHYVNIYVTLNWNNWIAHVQTCLSISLHSRLHRHGIIAEGKGHRYLQHSQGPLSRTALKGALWWACLASPMSFALGRWSAYPAHAQGLSSETSNWSP